MLLRFGTDLGGDFLGEEDFELFLRAGEAFPFTRLDTGLVHEAIHHLIAAVSISISASRDRVPMT